MFNRIEFISEDGIVLARFIRENGDIAADVYPDLRKPGEMLDWLFRFIPSLQDSHYDEKRGERVAGPENRT